MAPAAAAWTKRPEASPWAATLRPISTTVAVEETKPDRKPESGNPSRSPKTRMQVWLIAPITMIRITMKKIARGLIAPPGPKPVSGTTGRMIMAETPRIKPSRISKSVSTERLKSRSALRAASTAATSTPEAAARKVCSTDSAPSTTTSSSARLVVIPACRSACARCATARSPPTAANATASSGQLPA